jgi:undecaprenyl diphosphate synthase
MLLVDGDRRWAAERGLGVDAGYQAMSTRAAWCAEQFAARGVGALYVPVCSMSNLGRPPEQVRSFLDAMLDLPGRAAIPLEVTVGGNLDALPGDYRDRYLDLAKAHRVGFPVHLLLAWSLDDEVLRLVNRFRDHDGPVSTPELAAAADISEPIDLIIRTGRVTRLSSFVPFASPYAELVFLDIYFPDITVAHLDHALAHLDHAERRYGR